MLRKDDIRCLRLKFFSNYHMVKVVLLENILYVPGLQCERHTITLLRTTKSSSQVVLFKTCILLISVSFHRMFMDFILLHMTTFHSKRSINPLNCGTIALFIYILTYQKNGSQWCSYRSSSHNSRTN